MNVAEILRNKGSRIVSVQPSDTVVAAAALLSREGIGAVLVRDGDRVAGILSERDIVRCVAAHGEGALRLPVSDTMTRGVVFCSPQDSIDEVMSLMTERRFRHLPVQEHGKLVGLVSIGDVVKRRIESTEREARALREYIATG